MPGHTPGGAQLSNVVFRWLYTATAVFPSLDCVSWLRELRLLRHPDINRSALLAPLLKLTAGELTFNGNLVRQSATGVRKILIGWWLCGILICLFFFVFW
jgi:hypothetical protein